ncbi:MAG: hypothetical protein ABJB01_10980 [Rudaea sp.]
MSALIGQVHASEDATHVVLNIPSTHPRLWYGNAARLQQARTFFPNPIAANASDFYTRALNGVINANAADCAGGANCKAVVDCKAAASYFNSYIIDAGGFRDNIRQNGEDLLLIFDWCHNQFTPQQIHTIVDRWNGYLDQEFNDHSLGNTGDEANNYWAGRVMNFLNWGIASFGDTGTNGQTTAQTYIDHALVDRMGVGFPRWYGDFGKGGVFPEGDEYGVVSLAYPLIAFTSAADFGYDQYAQTPYYREAIYALIYGTTPGPSSSLHGPSNQYSMMPFSDDELFVNGAPINGRDYLGDFATLFGTRLPGSGNSKHILAWQAQSHAGRRSIFTALGTTGNPNDLATMPLDYFAPGAAVMDMRTSHDANATQVHLQLGTPGGTEHRHLDGGTFQFWRKGRWMTRESVGYDVQSGQSLIGFNKQGTMDVGEAPAHNALLFEGRSTGIWIGGGPQAHSTEDDQPRALPQVTRLQHEDQFGFVAADYSNAYRNGLDTRVDWPYAERAMREFLFIRPLQALVILDRMRGSSDSQRAFYGTSNWLESGPRETGANVRRTFVMHFENQPTANANGDRISAAAGTQTSELITLVPATPYKTASTFRLINERAPQSSADDMDVAQFRLELDSKGSLESYFLNVVTGYDAGEAKIAASVQDFTDHWVITLTHPTRGNATVTLMKGMTSTGGSVQIGAGAAVPLRSDVQGISVNDSGPVWETDFIFKDGFGS